MMKEKARLQELGLPAPNELDNFPACQSALAGAFPLYLLERHINM